jgi:5'-nucleotidase
MRIAGIGLAIVVASCATPAAVPRPAAVWLDVVATTDTHGHIAAQTSRVGTTMVSRGGAHLLSGYVAAIRKANPKRVLLLDSGDLFTGTLAADLTEGLAVIDAMNALGYDAAAVGNHEFDFGPVGPSATIERPDEDPRGALRVAAKAAKFPLLSANLVDPRGEPWSSKFTILDRDGIKVAIVGGSTDSTRATTIADNLAGMTITKLRESSAQAIRDARAAGATVIVLAVHAGGNCRTNPPFTETSLPDDPQRCDPNEELWKLAQHLAMDPATRPDLLLGGHTHRALTAVVAGIPVLQAEPKGRGFATAALEIATATGKPTGRFRVEPSTYTCSHHIEGSQSCPPHPPANTRWVPATYRGELINPDRAVLTAIEPHLARADAQSLAPLGVRLPSKLDAIYSHENALGNFIADVLRAAGKAEIGAMNGGGIRADLPAGEVTFGHAFEVLPFHNRLSIVGITGAQLKKLLLGNVVSNRGVLSISGLTVDAHCRDGKPQIEVRTTDGQLLEDARQYRVATVDFLTKGGDDFAELDKLTDAGGKSPLVRDLLIDELKRRATLDPRALYDKQNPRWRIEGHRRPLRCR